MRSNYVSLEYRLLNARESELLCQGIERVYGSTYPIPEFYDATFVHAAIAEEKLYCVVAMNEEHEVVACMSTVLEAQGDVTADGSALLVAPEYRSQGIVARLGETMLGTYSQLKLGGLHLYALALHDRVQKQSQAAGAVVTGVLPAWFSRQAKVAGYDYPDARIGAVTLYMPLGILPERTCYLPRRYASPLNSIYERLNLRRILRPADRTTNLRTNTVLETEEKTANSQLRIIVHDVGENIASALQRIIEGSRHQQVDVIYVDIPLGDPCVDSVVETARSLGFFFGALMVDRRGSDRLRMQRYKSLITAPNNMVIASPETATLLDYILDDSRQVQASAFNQNPSGR
jgi:GNAT superfamily N-acetyltransferase